MSRAGPDSSFGGQGRRRSSIAATWRRIDRLRVAAARPRTSGGRLRIAGMERMKLLDRHRIASLAWPLLARRPELYFLGRHWYRRLDPELRRKRDDTRRFFSHFLSDGDLCFDIGANRGQTTEAFLLCNARVVAVEPNPLCVSLLRWQFGGRPEVTIVEKAVGSRVGFAELHFEGMAGTGSLREDWPLPTEPNARPNRTVRRVEMTTLDELIARFSKPRFCKVDVEGYEAEVFRGLSQAIPLIYFEFHTPEIPRALDCLARLEELGPIRSVSVSSQRYSQYALNGAYQRSKVEELLRHFALHSGNIIVEMQD
jgi:FkbM family methyltransferase